MKRVLDNPYARKKLKTATGITTTNEAIVQKPFDLFETLPSNHEQYSINSITSIPASSSTGAPPQTMMPTPAVAVQQPRRDGTPSLSNNLTVWQRPSVSQSLSFGAAEILTLPQACQLRGDDAKNRSIRVTGVVLYRCCIVVPPGEENHPSIHLVLGDPIAPLRTSSILKEPSVKMAPPTATTAAKTTTTITAATPISSLSNKKTTTSSVLFDKSKTKKIVFRKKTERRLSFAATGSLAKVDPAVQFQDVLAATPNRLWVVAPAGTVLNVQDTVTVLGETQLRDDEGRICLVARIVRKTNGMHMKLYHEALLARQARLALNEPNEKEEESPTTST
jgi:Telomere-capping, CST complex subunit